MAARHMARACAGSRRSWQDLCQDLVRLCDEASALHLGEELILRYKAFRDAEITEFFQYILENFRVDHQVLNAAIEAYRADPSPRNVQRLNRASLPPRRKLFELICMCPAGMSTLLQMRCALLNRKRSKPELAAVDSDLEILFGNWFNRGLLTLERIDWSTPAFVLEKLIAFEAVHEIQGWDDLKRRVSHGRRCYAFFHPVLPHEPIIFVQVALTVGIASSIRDVICEDRPEDEARADTAIFYSISNCQDGLRGIAFGDLLIIQVADLISRELPNIRTFSTLSPIPGFATWLSAVSGHERQAEIEFARKATGQAAWWQGPSQDLQQRLRSLCTSYLTTFGPDGRLLDPVARFHLRNGARLERINWMGDGSEKGLRQSHGLLVNYVYDLLTVTRNHEKFLQEYVVTTSTAVKQLANKRFC